VRFGAIVTVTPHGGREAGMAFADKLRLSQLATSLGGTHTVVSHVASTTHRQLDDRALAAGGIDPGAVRFSIGLEDAEDLISDAYVALERSAGRSLVVRFGLGTGGRVGQPKIRVAVVFGGRSTEHAVSCASAGLILSVIDHDRYEVLPIGIATDGRWVLTSGDPARLALSSGSVPSVESVAVGDGEIVSRAGPGRLGSAGDEPGLGAAGPRLGGRGAAAAARHLRRGRHAAGPARDDRHPVRRRGRVRQRGRHGQGVHEAAHVRARPAGRPVRGGARPGLAGRGGAQAAPGRDRRAGLAGVRQACPRRLEHRDHPGLPGDELEPAIEAARAHDPKVLVEAAVDGIEVECAVLEGLDGGRPRRACPARSWWTLLLIL
jgi:O-acetylhomoserine sulfhydrylase